MESLKHLALTKTIYSPDILKPFGEQAFEDCFEDEDERNVAIDLIALDKSKNNIRNLFHFLKHYPEEKREKIIGYFLKHNLFAKEIKQIKDEFFLPSVNDKNFARSYRPENEQSSYRMTKEEYKKFIDNVIESLSDLVLPLENCSNPYEYLTEIFNENDVICLINEERKKEIVSLYYLVLKMDRKAIVSQHVNLYSNVIQRLGDAVYGIFVEGTNIKKLVLQMDSIIIEELTQPDEDGIWHFQTFKNIMNSFPLIAFQEEKIKIIGFNPDTMKMICHYVLFEPDTRRKIAMDSHSLPLPSGKTLFLSGGKGTLSI